MKKVLAALVFALGLGVASQASAQKLERHFIPPRLVIKHQAELQLTDKQKKEIRQAVKSAQSKTTDLQFEMQDEAAKLKAIVSKDKIDRKAALAQAKKVMSIENRIKETRLELLITTKNTLTPSQWEKVEKYRAEQKEKRRANKKARRNKF